MDRNLIMISLLLLIAVCLSVGDSSTKCQEDYQCDSGVCKAGNCLTCLTCKSFGRSETSIPSSPCITSVINCGPCLNGLVEDEHGDLKKKCVLPGAISEDGDIDHDSGKESGHPIYQWCLWGLFIVVIIVAAVCGIVYIVKNPTKIKILASTRTSVQSCPPAASAPEMPPAYDVLYDPGRSFSPVQHPQLSEEDPFIKPGLPEAARGGRVIAGAQAASVFNNPHYVRGPHLPNSYPVSPAESVVENDFGMDEDTAQSDWRPAPAASPAPSPTDAVNNNEHLDGGESSGLSGGAGGGAGGGAAALPALPALPALLAAARDTTLVQPPPAKQPRLQDTNNNRNSDPEPEAIPRAGGIGAPTVNIHVNFQQYNDVKL